MTKPCNYLLRYLLFILTCCYNATAQDFLYDHYGKEEGLSGNTVYCITQDIDGFIWLGTDNGLSRFDGDHFQNYTVEDGLADNEVLEVFSDSRGRTWFVGFTGAVGYYYKGKIYNSTNEKNLARLGLKHAVSSMTEDRNQNVYFLGGEAAVFLKNGDMKFLNARRIFDQTNPTSAFPLKMCYRSSSYEGAKVFVSIYGIGLFLPEDELKFLQKGDFSFKSHIPTSIVFGVETKDPRYIYLFTRDEYDFVEIDSVNKKLSVLSWKQRKVNRISFDVNTGDSWVASKDSGAQKITPGMPEEEKHLVGKDVSNVMTDIAGNTWFTTLDNGIYMLRKNEFTVYKHELCKSNENMQEMTVTSDKSLWIGINNCCIAKYQNNNLVTGADLSGKQTQFGALRQISASEDLIVAALDRGVFSIPENKFRNLNRKVLGAVKSVSVCNSSSFYLANHIGLYLVKPESIDTIARKERFTFLSNSINGITMAASVRYLYEVNGKSLKKVENYSIADHGRITDIQINDKGDIAIATYSKGIHCIRNGNIYSVDFDDGLISNHITDITFQNDSTIWVVTDKGLSSVDVEFDNSFSCSINNYYLSGDIPYCNIRRIEFLNDTAWLATDRGLVYFRKGNLSSEKKFNIVITDVFQEGRNLDLSINKPITSLNGKALRVSFAAILFTGNKELFFKYWLKGIDKHWTVTTQRNIEFASLPPGSYFFEVYAENKDGHRSNNVAQLQFIIEPLWYQTKLFRITIIVLFALIVMLLVQSRIKTVRKKTQQQAAISRRLSELQLEAIRSQLNPHFIFNSLNAVQNFLVDHEPDQANSYLSDFSTVIRKSLLLSRNNFTFLKEELELLQSYLRLEYMRFEGAFDYSIVADEIDASRVIAPTMIFQHYVENAVKHGVRGLTRKGCITVRFYKKENNVICEIEDNGNGIVIVNSMSNDASGLGMKMHHDRVQLIAKTFNIKFDITVIDKSTLAAADTGIIVKIVWPDMKPENMHEFNQIKTN